MKEETKNNFNDVIKYSKYGPLGRVMIVLIIVITMFIPSIFGFHNITPVEVNSTLMEKIIYSLIESLISDLVVSMALFIIFVTIVGITKAVTWIINPEIEFDSAIDVVFFPIIFIGRLIVFAFNFIFGESDGKDYFIKLIKKSLEPANEKAKKLLLEEKNEE